MSEFTTPLIVSPLADGKSWRLVYKLTYFVGSLDSDDTITTPPGFVTDFASVPRVFWWIIPKWGKYGNAAVIHDWLYWRQEGRTRTEADAVLYEAMGVLKVSRWKKNVIYRAVRLFGWIAWMRNRAEKANGRDRVIAMPGKATSPSNRPGTLSSMYTYLKSRGVQQQ